MKPDPPRLAWVLAGLLAGCLAPARPPVSSPAPAHSPPEGYRLPLDRAKILSPYGPRSRRFHTGLDIRDGRQGGEPVRASRDGVVRESRRRGGYGRTVLIRHGDGWSTRYAHLGRLEVREGQRVRAGDRLGTVGRSGRATGYHLHFEILTPEGRPVNPSPFLFKSPGTSSSKR